MLSNRVYYPEELYPGVNDFKFTSKISVLFFLVYSDCRGFSLHSRNERALCLRIVLRICQGLRCSKKHSKYGLLLLGNSGINSFNILFYGKQNLIILNCLQEVLKTFSISPDGANSHLWNRFSSKDQHMIFPLLTSHYTRTVSNNEIEFPHPIYG